MNKSTPARDPIKLTDRLVVRVAEISTPRMYSVIIFASENPRLENSSPRQVMPASNRAVTKSSLPEGRIFRIGPKLWVRLLKSAEESGIM